MMKSSYHYSKHALFLGLILMILFVPRHVWAVTKTITIYPEPSSGVAPLEVNLRCAVVPSTAPPEKYIINYGDGSKIETVDTDEYVHIFTHVYQSGYFKPKCSIVKALGTTVESDPASVIVAKWRFKTGGDVDSSPAIGPDGTVYVGSDDGNLYALDPDTGQEIWRFHTLGEIKSSPAVDAEGTVYFGSLDKNFYAVNSRGGLKWSFEIGDYIFSSPAISPDGRTIYVGASDNSLYALSAAGTLKWKYETGGKIVSSPAIGYDGFEYVVYFGSLDRHVYALSADTGDFRWSFETGTTVYGSPAVGPDGKIYVGEVEIGHAKEYKFKFYCLNVDGSKQWEYVDTTGFYSSPAIGPEDLVYVGSHDGYLFAFDRNNGTVGWSVRTQPPRQVESSPAIGNNPSSGIVAYVGCKDGNLYALQSSSVDEDRRENWVFKTGDAILYSSPVIDDNGTIYFGSHDNFVYAVNPGTMTRAASTWPMFHGDPSHKGYPAANIELPEVISSDPANAAKGVDRTITQITINFAPDVVSSQVDVDSFKLYRVAAGGTQKTPIDGYAVLNWSPYNQAGSHLSAVFTRLNDAEPLAYNAQYSASINYSTAPSAENGNEGTTAPEVGIGSGLGIFSPLPSGDNGTEEAAPSESGTSSESKTFSCSFTTETQPTVKTNPDPKADFGCFIDTLLDSDS